MPKAAPTVRTMQSLSAQHAAEKLSELSLGIATGEIAIGDGENLVKLHPAGEVRLAFEGSEDGRAGRLTIELAWKPSLRIAGD